MFSNIRIISVLASVLIILIAFATTHLVKNYAINKLIVPQYQQLTDEIISFYTETVWNRYSAIIDYVGAQPQTEWLTYPQYLSFTNDSKSILSSKNLLKTTITVNDGVKIYDSAPTVVLSGKDEDGVSVELVKSSEEDGEKALLTITKNVEYTTPSDDEKSTPFITRGTVKFKFDVNSHYSNLDAFQYMLTIIIAIVILPITTLIFISSRKVEDLLEKQQEASLELANAKAVSDSESRAKSQFLANVSHELRTPLNAIIGFSDIINSESMGPLNNEQYKEFVRDIHTSGVHLLSLINDILDFSKAEENKLQIDMEPVDITKTIKVCLRMVMTRANEAGVKLVDEVPNEHFNIAADSKRMKQIVLNLLSNAIKFTPESGTVTIRAWQNKDENNVTMEIEDTGVGMAAQDLARALSPFGQVENKLSKRFEGTGLGLPLTKKLVELMHGEFDVRSEPGLGTTVTIKMPVDGVNPDEIEGSKQSVISKPKVSLSAERKDDLSE